MSSILLTTFAYLATILCIISKLTTDGGKRITFPVILGVASFSVLLHFVTLSNQLSNITGAGITLMNIISFACLLMSLIATLALTKWENIWLSLLVIYSLSCVSLILSGILTGNTAQIVAKDSILLFHIFVAMFSYALFFIALLYVFQLRFIDARLKNKKNLLLKTNLPPLITVEKHLFTLTLLAQLLLTITLITGAIYLPHSFVNEQLNKTLLSCLAWFVYAILLFGQWKLYWRGKRVLIYSISGMILLTAGYFGSQL